MVLGVAPVILTPAPLRGEDIPVLRGPSIIGPTVPSVFKGDLNSTYRTRSTSSDMTIALTTPPMTTVASGRCTSAPTPVLNAIGTKPRLATSVVISTGRSRVSAAWFTASSSGRPFCRSWRT